MQQENIEPNDVSFVNILKAFSNTTSIDTGLQLHGYYIEGGCQFNVYVGNTLIDMYAKCGHLDDAYTVFNALPSQSVVTWNAMIAGYAQHGHADKALRLFQKMQEQHCQPNSITIVCALKACSRVPDLEDGKLIHAFVLERGCESEVFVGNGLIALYANCASLVDALSVFHKLPELGVVTWNTMIVGFTQLGICQEALQLFQRMQENAKPNNTTFVSVLKACSGLAALEQGKQIHALIIESECELDVDVGNTLLDMYAKCGSLKDACKVFNGLPKQNLVTWNAMITAYVQHGYGQDALCVFQEMQQAGLKPSSVTYISMFKACSRSLVAKRQGKLIHAHLMESNCIVDISLGNALVDMYTKCGSLEDAHKVLVFLPKECVEAWNTLICGHAHHQNGHKLALRHFEGMLQAGLKPDEGTLVSILSACSHLGFVEEGCHHFKTLCEDFGITPMLDHYSCMGDLLGRAGCLNEAEDVLQTMPLPSNIVGWTSLLSHCRMHGNFDVGKHCLAHLVTPYPQDVTGHSFILATYADAGMRETVDKIHEVENCAAG